MQTVDFEDKQTLDLIRQAVSNPRQPLTSDEFNLFVSVARYTGLNPLMKEIYAARIDGRFTILSGIDGYRKIAQKSPRFRGQAGPFWCGEDGEWKDVWLANTPPVACKVGVYMPGRQEPTWGIAYYKNYRDKKTPTWQSMPEHMLAIRAEAFALRKCFNREIGNVAIADDDEMPTMQASVVEQEEQPRQALSAPKAAPKAPPQEATPVEDEPELSKEDQFVKLARVTFEQARAAGLNPDRPQSMKRSVLKAWKDKWDGALEEWEEQQRDEVDFTAEAEQGTLV